MEYSKDNLQKLLVVAGLTPRDLTRIMPCNPGTMYAYFKSGGCRQLTLLAFNKIFQFLTVATDLKLLPSNYLKNSKRRQETLHRMYNHWHFHKGLEGFEI